MEGSWAIGERKTLVGSCNEYYKDQKNLIKEFEKETLKAHEVPTMLKMIGLMAAEKIKFNQILLESHYTRCQESVNWSPIITSQVVVKVNSFGIFIDDDYFASVELGALYMTALRTFKR